MTQGGSTDQQYCLLPVESEMHPRVLAEMCDFYWGYFVHGLLSLCDSFP